MWARSQNDNDQSVQLCHHLNHQDPEGKCYKFFAYRTRIYYCCELESCLTMTGWIKVCEQRHKMHLRGFTVTIKQKINNRYNFFLRLPKKGQENVCWLKIFIFCPCTWQCRHHTWVRRYSLGQYFITLWVKMVTLLVEILSGAFIDIFSFFNLQKYVKESSNRMHALIMI